MQTNYKRRQTNEVTIGTLKLGANNPIRLQSMLNTFTTDTEKCVEQSISIIKAGGELVRATTPGMKDAQNMANIRAELNKLGFENIPLVADVHFTPNVANEAALHIEKVRINPGNYANTLEDIKAKFIPFLELCKQNNTAIRIGVNHGSLGQRIMDKFGDTPEGLSESCMEFLRICKEQDFNNVVISVKSSNVRVMVQTVRQIVRRMNEENMHYPMHLGVTEAGEGEDGRIKSAAGIGCLLLDGIGDTIRVSLSEAPEAEIPVAKKIVEFVNSKNNADILPTADVELCNGEKYERRKSAAIENIGGSNLPVVMVEGDIPPTGVRLIELDHINALGQGRLALAEMNMSGDDSPVIVSRKYDTDCLEDLQLQASIELGAFFIDGLADGIQIIDPNFSKEQIESLSYGILQATRARMSKTEYISCPSCGRTLFNIQEAIAKIKAETSHLKTLKIGIMGCIVNGPGEMADADYGYVGAGRGKISLYKGQTCVKKNIDEGLAVHELINLIKENGDWVEK